MPPPAFALFATPIGECAIAWADERIVAVELPQPTREALAARIARKGRGAAEQTPSPAIGAVIARIGNLLAGGADDLTDIDLDFGDAPALHRRVWEIARTVPPGATTTYGEIAVRIGDKQLAREVGRALGANPIPIIVPCHRVLAANGRIGGFSAPGGIATKRRMLAIESALAKGDPTLFDR